MGNRLTWEDKPEQTESREVNIFDELFPDYLMMGMTPEDYWDGESSLKPAYRKAYQLKIENEQRIADRDNWYMGQYILAALQSFPLLVAGLNVKKGAQLPDYPDKPFLQKMEEEKQEEVRRKQQEDQSRLAMAMFQAMVSKFNKNVEARLERERQAGTGQ